MKTFKLLCIGDSITEAWNLNHTEGWTYLMGKQLDIEVVNAGISGDTTAGMMSRASGLMTITNPDCVLIMGGTNDLYIQVPFSVTISNLMAVIRYGRKLDIPVILGIPPAVYSTDDIAEASFYLSTQELSSKMKDYHKKLIEFARIEADGHIDFSEALSADQYFEDGVHPNSEGHRAMSHVAVMTFKSQLCYLLKD